MSCGCAGTPAVTQDEQRARALMCQTCIYAEHDSGEPWMVGAVECRISGKPVADHILSPAPTCPKNRHGPVLTWLGIRWYGAPYPLRKLMFWWLRGPVPSCGCIRVLKDRWVRFRDRSNRG
jgi:hypothetical protein